MPREIKHLSLLNCVLAGFFFIVVNSVWLFASENCQACHKEMQSSCKLTCEECHISSTAPGQIQPADHPKVIANPSKEAYWQEKCAPCHAKEIEKFKNSLHYSLAGIIGQTRFLWGKTNSPLDENPTESRRELLQLKTNAAHSTAELADALLAQKCLSCHFEAEGRTQAKGRKRAAGCASCHIPLDQKSGKPLFGHKMQQKVSDATCMTCHSGNRVGADYYGYFEHDYHKAYQTPYGAEAQFASFQHRMVPDVHQLAGLQCMDCHSRPDVMGGITASAFEGQNRDTRKCTQCHGGFDHIVQRIELKNSVPQFDKTVIAHKEFHHKVSCAACHAGWSYQDYGLHLFFDQSNHYDQWGDFIWQDDAEITHLLQEQLNRPPGSRQNAHTRNKLSGKAMAGAWYKGWTFRRWEGIVLGKGEKGLYVPIRPLYQYYVTYVDSLDNVWLDSQIPLRKDGKPGWNWDTYAPHTIQAGGRACENCHGNTLAAGLGIRSSLKDSVANAITLPSAPILPLTRLLNSHERKKLLYPSARYKKWRIKAMKKNGLLKLLHN